MCGDKDLSKAFMTVKEVAGYLAVKSKTVYSWAEIGKLPAYKINGVLRFRVQEIEGFVRAGRVENPDPLRIAKKAIGKRLFLGNNRLDNGQRMP